MADVFLATAPISGDAHIHVLPKGLDTRRILDDRTVAYLDLAGSGAETIAHLRENGRIVLIFCAYTSPSRIVRLHGRGEVISLNSPEVAQLAGLFPNLPGARAIIRVNCDRISDSCGTGVPRCEFVGHKDALTNWAAQKGPNGMSAYRDEKKRRSIDGLPALESELPYQ
ncbi:MAG: pyridoxamine 5'-phosphate oxidase family protein [Pirellulales bacterium]|nr:pyridoxamine 5'-phosphate oxidase family protein [Pirellulales bacterium]